MDLLQNVNCCQCIDNLSDNENVIKRLSCITSLYIYLNRHFKYSPILLNRNLSYIRKKTIKKKKKSVDNICKLLWNKNTSVKTPIISLNMNTNLYEIEFKGFFDGDSECEWETVQAIANISVVHQWNDRRKCSFGRKSNELLSNIDLLCNKTNMNDNKYQFSQKQLFDGANVLRVIYSYILFEIRAFERRKRDDTNDKCDTRPIYPVNYETKFPIYKHVDDSSNYLLNGSYELRLELSNNQPKDEFHERYRNGYEIDIKEEMNNDENNHNREDSDGSIDNASDISSPRIWIGNSENLNRSHINSINRLREYAKWPKLIFQLTSFNSNNVVEQNHSLIKLTNNHTSHLIVSVSNHIKQENNAKTIDFVIQYKFFNKDNLIQSTQTQQLKCPWCSFNKYSSKKSVTRLDIRNLLKHLQTFHSRLSFKCYFDVSRPDNRSKSRNNNLNGHLKRENSLDSNLKYIAINNIHQHNNNITNSTINGCNKSKFKIIVMEVRINQSYDGSVEIGLRRFHSKANNKPQKKQLFTQIIYSKYILQFKNTDPSIEQRPLVWGHNRNYFHTVTGMLLHSAEDMDQDSELEDYPEWLKKQYNKRIEEFSDVNPGEKRIMQLWNYHLLQYKYHGDYATSELTTSFIKKMVAQIKFENLRYNLILHLSNLVDYGLLTPQQFVDNMLCYDSFDTDKSHGNIQTNGYL